MLRRRPDGSFELRLVEQALFAAAPPRLSRDRKEILWAKVQAGLGAQQNQEPRWGLAAGERWVAVPAGIGIVAAIIAAAKFTDGLSSTHSGASSSTASKPNALQIPTAKTTYVADADRWLTFDDNIAVGVEAGSEISSSLDGTRLRFVRGRVSVAASGNEANVEGDGFTAVLAADSVAVFESRNGLTLVSAVSGLVHVTYAAGTTVTLEAGDTAIVPTLPASAEAPLHPAAPDKAKGALPAETRVPEPKLGVSDQSPTAHAPSSPSSPAVNNSHDVRPPVETPAFTPTGAVGQSPTTDASRPGQGASGNPGGESDEPPRLSGGGNGNGTTDANAGGNGNGTGAANSNAGGNSNGDGAANSNAGGNGNGAANSNAGGNGNGPANSNAGGNGNGNGAANSNAGSNGNGAANSNAGGNGNGAANSNAGGNGNGNGAADSNAGGNGNGNGAANSNAGGKGNGKGQSN